MDTHERGLALVRHLVTAMGFDWDDTGRPGVCNGGIRMPSGDGVVLVHSYARDRAFAAETDRRFHYHCATDTVNRWMACADPVVVVCSHPNRHAAWWEHTQSWFADPDHRASGTIVFHKRGRRVTASTGADIRRLLPPP